VKLIDFSESVPIDKPFDEAEAKILGSTIPFSPLECTTLSKEGYNETNIDLWSLGVILYHETFGKIPITYSKCFAQDILKGWKNTG
jgi:serine/threonine protein kinase